jgi:fibronectin type III domain protein
MSNLVGDGRSVRRGLVALGVVAAGFLMAIAVVASAQTTDTATTGSTGTTGATGTTSTGGSGPVISLGNDGRVVFVGLVAGLFAALWFALLWYDRRKTNERITVLLNALIADTSRPRAERLTAAEIRALTSAAATRGATGLTRTTIALGLLTLVGVVLAALLVGNGSNASDLLKTVATALTTALTTVLGFYFGAKTTTDAVAQVGAPAAGAGAPAKPGTPPDPPSITGVEPGSGEVTVTFTAPENTGDSPITGYTVTSDPDAKTAPGSASPIVVTGLTPGVEYTFTVHATSASGDSKESGKSEPAKPLE